MAALDTIELCSSKADYFEFTQGAGCCHASELPLMLFSLPAMPSPLRHLPSHFYTLAGVCRGQAFPNLPLYWTSNSPAGLLFSLVHLINSVHTTEEVLYWKAVGCDLHPSLTLACKTHFIPLHILGALCNEQHQEWLVLVETAHRIKSSHKLLYLHLYYSSFSIHIRARTPQKLQ